MLHVAIEEDVSHVSTYEVLPDFLVLFPASPPKENNPGPSTNPSQT